jgi:hypothetical protein
MCNLLEQPFSRTRDLLNGGFKSRLIHLGRLMVSADLPYELQGRGGNLFPRRGRGFRMAEHFDATAHDFCYL